MAERYWEGWIPECQASCCKMPEAGRADLTVPEFPTMPDGTTLTAMRVSSNPERFIYGDADALTWVRERWERRLASDEGER